MWDVTTPSCAFYWYSIIGVEYAFASDVRPGPLENARRTIQAYGLSDCIEPRLCSGLSGFGPADADYHCHCRDGRR